MIGGVVGVTQEPLGHLTLIVGGGVQHLDELRPLPLAQRLLRGVTLNNHIHVHEVAVGEGVPPQQDRAAGRQEGKEGLPLSLAAVGPLRVVELPLPRTTRGGVTAVTALHEGGAPSQLAVESFDLLVVGEDEDALETGAALHNLHQLVHPVHLIEGEQIHLAYLLGGVAHVRHGGQQGGGVGRQEGVRVEQRNVEAVLAMQTIPNGRGERHER
ncbi:hypothetical protein AGDE_14928 [Angomonas deanei]|nr:hypothetical protein AGDE_14928 [Angomonas deanei]|eukprot:EPY19980.1 hypothetical protein AGDE_14928 [Angomonas deanei]